mgnify:CR=1 FL=1
MSFDFYFLIDYHQLNSSDTERPYSPFVWHVDDYGATPYNTHTIIFYLRKDRSLKGGNLLYLDKSLPDDYDDKDFAKVKDRLLKLEEIE